MSTPRHTTESSIHNLLAQRRTALKSCSKFDAALGLMRENGETDEALCAAATKARITLRLLEIAIGRRREQETECGE
jgi:hypothetical protein